MKSFLTVLTTIGIIIGIFIGMVFCGYAIDEYLWNNGTCRICGQAYEFIDNHWGGRSNNIYYYDYQCGCSKLTTFSMDMEEDY